MSRSPSAMLRLLPLLSLVAYATSLPLSPETIPVVIWHGLGDQFDAPGLASLKSNLEMREDLGKPFVWIVRIEESGSADS
jgi:palmitoyl-protein thioesterase